METVASADGTSIAYERFGDGPPLILVGGAMSDRTAATPLAELLSSCCSVLAYDRRGRGESGDTAPYAHEREIEDLAALIEAAGGSASVHGHSSGAVLALEAAAYGLPITKLALYEPPFMIDDSRPPVPDDFVATLEALVASDRRGDAVAYFMTTGVGLPSEMVERGRNEQVWPGLERLAHTLAYDGRIMGDTMSGRQLPAGRWSSVTIPVLVLDGGASPEWQRNAARALAEVLPNAEHRTLEGQTHAVDPAVLAPVLREFLGS
jgi:pimeloyl-ACP methyl ester carboxylesterase